MWYYGRSAFGDTAGIEPRIRETSGATTDTYKTATCIANVLASSVYQLVEQMRKKSIPVGRLCRVLGVSRSGATSRASTTACGCTYPTVHTVQATLPANYSIKLEKRNLQPHWEPDGKMIDAPKLRSGPISNDHTEALARGTFSLVVLGGYTIQNPAAPAT